MNRIEKLINKKKFIPLNQFINIALYDKELGYYQNKKIFGRNGDFITSPHISSIFSEMISIWIVSYWLYILYCNIHPQSPTNLVVKQSPPSTNLLVKTIFTSTTYWLNNLHLLRPIGLTIPASTYLLVKQYPPPQNN